MIDVGRAPAATKVEIQVAGQGRQPRVNNLTLITHPHPHPQIKLYTPDRVQHTHTHTHTRTHARTRTHALIVPPLAHLSTTTPPTTTTTHHTPPPPPPKGHNSSVLVYRFITHHQQETPSPWTSDAPASPTCSSTCAEGNSSQCYLGCVHLALLPHHGRPIVTRCPTICAALDQ
jgi:hypothetical protein